MSESISDLTVPNGIAGDIGPRSSFSNQYCSPYSIRIQRVASKSRSISLIDMQKKIGRQSRHTATLCQTEF
ncbi:hypothetical protein L2E82_33110 [Cichorium intybus]|uniref:Uncharacterized protein n=1 Tax=Cichorium intybus TaxID=13427 RepID=A0ACB9BJ99_CICIN|nr:hypothetical protein L2E82_33110 [Cichorium intybus]